jgi:hypothetical protein
MAWTNYLSNKRLIEFIYPKAPELSGVRIHEVRLNQDGPTMSVRFDLSELPDNPPPKWAAARFNRVQLTLSLVQIDRFLMSGWGLDNIGDVTIEQWDGGVRLKCIGPSLRVDCCARFMEVQKLSGYCDSKADLR